MIPRQVGVWSLWCGDRGRSGFRFYCGCRGGFRRRNGRGCWRHGRCQCRWDGGCWLLGRRWIGVIVGDGVAVAVGSGAGVGIGPLVAVGCGVAVGVSVGSGLAVPTSPVRSGGAIVTGCAVAVGSILSVGGGSEQAKRVSSVGMVTRNRDLGIPWVTPVRRVFAM